MLHFCQGGRLVSLNTINGKYSKLNLPSEDADLTRAQCYKISSGLLAVVCPVTKSEKNAYHIFEIRDGKIQRRYKVNGVKEFNYRNACWDDDGNFFAVGKQSKSVLKFDRFGKKVREVLFSVNGQNVFCLVKGFGNAILLAADNIWKLPEGGASFELHPVNKHVTRGLYGLDMEESKEGDLWLAMNNNHLVYYDAKKDQAQDYFKDLEKLIPNKTFFSDLHIDQFGDVWFTSTVGLLHARINKSLFHSYFTDKSTFCGGYCSFRGFAEDRDGDVYASFYNNIFRIKADGSSSAKVEYPFEITPYDLKIHNQLLFLTTGHIFDLNSSKKEYTKNICSGLNDGGVFSTDGNGNLWWVCYSSVHRLDTSSGFPKWIPVLEIPSRNWIRHAIWDESKRHVWLTDGFDMYSFDPATLSINKLADPLINQLQGIKALLPDKRGNLWITSENGLSFYQPTSKKVKHYTTKNGLSNDIVVGILPEGDSCLWLSTFKGLSRFNIKIEQFINFYEEDGLAANEFNRASYFKSSKGQMFFGGVKGVTAFYPEQVMKAMAGTQSKQQLLMRAITMTSAKHDSLTRINFFDPKEKIHIYHYNRAVTFQFGVFGAGPGEVLHYSYKLEGYDVEWSQQTEESSLQMGNLPVGSYTFRVRARNARGAWLSNEIAIPLVVHAPWWASRWAYLMYIAIICGIGYYFYHRWKTQLLLENELLKGNIEAERMKELDLMKSRFFTNITHEFRTPLTVILGMTDEVEKNLEKHPTQNNQIGALHLIKRNGNQLLALINQLLELSKIENKMLGLQLQQADLAAWLHAVVDNFQSLAQSKQINLTFQADAEAIIIDFDPTYLEQISGNILSNAIKFTPTGGNIHVLVTHTTKEVQISIEDTGVGISHEDLPHVFNRFYQASNQNPHNETGTGIGLALTEELVRLMNGSIAVESKLGVGSMFTVKLPITTIAPVEATPSARLKQIDHMPITLPDQPDSQKPLLLIVEDTPDILSFLIVSLNDYYQIVTAENGLVGTQKAIELIPDIIISDVMMPEMDGFELCHALKNNELTNHIPIVMLTAKADFESRIVGLQQGADDYMAKPFESVELLVRLENLVQIRKKMQAKFGLQRTLSDTEPAALPIETDPFLLQVLAIIDTHLSNSDFDVLELEQTLGMSRSQVYRKIKAITGESAVSLIRHARLQKAKELLSTTPMSVSQVAYSVGFTAPTYFAKSFTEVYGVSPTDYKKSIY